MNVLQAAELFADQSSSSKLKSFFQRPQWVHWGAVMLEQGKAFY